MRYYEINENEARRAKQTNSFYGYQEGSATEEYRKMVDEAQTRGEKAKKFVDEAHHLKIDSLVDLYARQLADNLNKRNTIDARVPSVMIAGPGNFPVAKKMKQNRARDTNFQEFKSIQNLLNKIDSVGRGGIRSDDENAKEKISKKLADVEKSHTLMKKVNAYYKKHGTAKGCEGIRDEIALKIDKSVSERDGGDKKPFASYTLSNNNAEIRRLKGRLESIEKMESAQLDDFDFEGGHVVFNKEAQRIQIHLDDRPTPEFKEKLKSNAFKWAPSKMVWQRQLTSNAIRSLHYLGLEKTDDKAKPSVVVSNYGPSNNDDLER